MTAGIFDNLPGLMMSVFKEPTRGIYTPADGGQAVSVDVIFDEAYRLVQEQDGVPVEVLRKAATLKTADVEKPRHGDRLELEGASYTVRGVVPGGGMNTLLLSD